MQPSSDYYNPIRLKKFRPLSAKCCHIEKEIFFLVSSFIDDSGILSRKYFLFINSNQW